MANYKKMPLEPTQIIMFPMSVNDSIPADSDVRTVSEAMDLLDWSGFESSRKGTGCPPYPPRVLAKIIVYGYSKGIRSSRALEEVVKNDKRYIFLSGGLEHDHSKIARFRKERQPLLRAAYRDTVRVCMEAGLVLLNAVSTDGSKIQALASKKSLYGMKRIDKVSEAIDRIFREAEEADRLEDEAYGEGTGRELPPELLDAKKRKEKLSEIAERLKESGRKNISASDAECRVMKTTGGLRPAYNVQITVDKENLVIVGADVTNSESDHGQLSAQLKEVEENTGCKPDVVLADTGYCDEGTLKTLSSSGQDALIPPQEQNPGRDRNNLFDSRCFFRDRERDVLVCPAGKDLTYRRTVKCCSGHYKVYTADGCRIVPSTSSASQQPVRQEEVFR